MADGNTIVTAASAATLFGITTLASLYFSGAHHKYVVPYYGTAECSEAIALSKRCEELLFTPNGAQSASYDKCKTDLDNLVHIIATDSLIDFDRCEFDRTGNKVAYCTIYRYFRQQKIFVTDELLVTYTKAKSTPVKSTQQEVTVLVNGKEKPAMMTLYENPEWKW